MSKIIDFYFDFISPYSYIAYKKIKSMQNKNGVDFNYKPIFLAGLHNLAGIDPPAFNKFKMKNMVNDCKLVSKKNNIQFSKIDNFIDDPFMYSNYRDYMKARVGSEIEKKYFRKYPEKIWGMKTSQMRADWAPKRIEIREKINPFFIN